MDTSDQSDDEFHDATYDNIFYDTTSEDMRLEIFCLIWLDSNITAKDNRDTEQRLRSIINRFKKFQDVKECQTYIEHQSQQDRIVMITSGSLGQEIVSSIHKLRQVISIYVYCMDKQRNKQWADKFPKVKAIITQLDELISCIKVDHNILKIVEEPLAINIFTTGTSTGGVNGQFIFSQVLIDCLLRLKSTSKDQTELITICKKAYEGNTFEMTNLHEFENKYSPTKALWWYTRDTFFYKAINAVLRSENIHMIFLFRQFISDIQHQLKENQVKSPIKVYRGQMISSDELKRLKEHCEQFISMNSFISTSTDEQQARVFLNVPNGAVDLESVLFEIEADPNMVTTKPFADISQHSEYPGESEILFMPGSIFRLESVMRSSENSIWIIRMKLCSDDDHHLKKVLTYMKQQLGNGHTNLQTLGRLLSDMSKFDLAERYFVCLLEELLPNDPLRIDLYQDLARVASQTSKFDQCMEWRQQAIALAEQIVISDIPLNAKWAQNGVIVAGGHGKGNDTNQLYYPEGIFVDDDQTIVIADCWNHRIVQWRTDNTNGEVVAGGHGQGNRLDQLNCPTNVLIDEKTDTLIISDRGNRRVVRWSRRSGTRQGEILIENIECWGLAMDNQRNLYVSDVEKHEIKKYGIGNKNAILVAGYGLGSLANQFRFPSCIFLDQQHDLYVADTQNNRVMKWNKGSQEGTFVAKYSILFNLLTYPMSPVGLFVDGQGTLYVAESGNNRVTRWPQGSNQSTIIAGGNGYGEAANQFQNIRGLSFDRHGNLFVVDGGSGFWGGNHRVQRFSIE
ncbi:unnamed protein product [Rotaria sp. Silwood2]|nr:unnamed protein product [Rotaria sp. Silwood2]